MYIKELSLIKLFTFFMCFSTIFTYFLNSNLINYFFIFPIIFLILILRVFNKSIYTFTKNELMILFFSFGYAFLSLVYYFNDPIYGKNISAQLMTILLIPFFIFFNLSYSKSYIASDYLDFLYRVIILFLLFQISICIGQISTYTFGVGLPVPEAQSSIYMVSGSFVNSNNLAVIIIFISYLVSQIESKFNGRSNFLIWLMIFIILLITVSRSALLIVFMIFILTRSVDKKKIIHFFVGGGILSAIIIIVYNRVSDFDFFNRINDRLESFSVMLDNGIMADDSMGIRLNSYLYFIDRIPELGLGSGEMYNYYNYSRKAEFDTNLLFINPHSYFVEIGYWLGFSGFVLFSIVVLLLFFYGKKNYIFLFIFILAVCIPSSILDFYLFFYFAFMCLCIKNWSYAK